MLKRIGLTKFKAFNEYTNLDIKPLTILCGVNSGGKSSIIKSLLLLKQSYENNSTTNAIVLNGLYTMNGTMKDVIYRKQGNYFIIENNFIIKDIGKKYFINAKQDISSAKELRRIFNTAGGGQFEIRNKITFNIGYQHNFIGTNYISEYVIEILYVSSKNKVINSSIHLTYKKGGGYDVDLINFPTIENVFNSVKLVDCVCYFSGMRINNLYCTKPPQNIKLQNFLPNLYSLFRIISNQYDGIKYLGPLRDFPERQYVVSRNNVGITTNGSNIPFVLAKNEKRNVNQKTLPPIDENNYNIKKKVANNLFIEAVKEWMSYFSLGKIELVNDNEVLTLKIDDINISDVGFGVSQVLPIIVESMALEQEQTLILEQPEIHLHPKMQMKMSDLILSMALSNHNVIVETHSDHIINRIVRRALECEDNSIIDNVAIYFVENTEKGSIISPIIMDRVQGIVECPEAFFSQFASETSQIIQAGFKNMQKGY